MRLLHTGDWHIGKRLYGNDRLRETQDVLAEVARIAEASEVDAVLVAGDNLDRRLVEPAVLSACLRAFEALALVAPVVAVTGNHEDPAFWRHLAPYLAPRIRLATSDEVVSIDTNAGRLTVGCVPWPEPAEVATVPGVDRGTSRGRYAELAAERIDRIAADVRRQRQSAGGVAVLLAHLMVSHGVTGGGERELTLGGTYAVPGQSLPQDLDYIALGHLHRPQSLPGVSGLGRYCGSPMALDFSGEGTAPSVAIVDLVGQHRQVTEVPVESGRKLVRLRGSLDQLVAAAAEHPDAWFFCEVEVEQIRLDIVREVRDRIPDALRVEVRSTHADGPGGLDPDEPFEHDLGEAYADWRAQTGRADDRVVAAFRAILARVEDEVG